MLLLAHPGSVLAEVVKRVQIPRKTCDRTLQELHLLGLLHMSERTADDMRLRWAYWLAEGISVTALTSGQKCQQGQEEREEAMTNTRRHCVTCSGKLPMSGSQRLQCEKCARKTCLQCSAPMPAGTIRKRFCSEACALQARSERTSVS